MLFFDGHECKNDIGNKYTYKDDIGTNIYHKYENVRNIPNLSVFLISFRNTLRARINTVRNVCFKRSN